jgi:putative ABC transport system permease protein
MLYAHVLTFFRNLRSKPAVTLINLGGLSVGIAVCILIALFVADELAYDRFHEKGDRIYRVVADMRSAKGEVDRFARASWPMGPAMVETYPEVEAAVRLIPTQLPVLHGTEYHFDNRVFFAEQTLFEVFSFPLVEGDPATALRHPNTVVLTRDLAERHFRGQSAVGQSLIVGDTTTVTVTGVVENVPGNSHIQFDLLISLATFEAAQTPDYGWDWMLLSTFTYVLVRPDADIGALRHRVSQMATERFGEVLEQVGFGLTMGLEHLPEIYLYSDRKAQMLEVSDPWTVYGFMAIALFVLVIACVNYMNLATARSLQRAREVGVRKTLGAQRGSLVRQFLGESIVLTTLALLVALLLAATALPVFNSMAGKELSMDTLLSLTAVVIIAGGVLLVGLLAGSYPAAVLSGFVPSRALQGEVNTSRYGIRLRQSLVVFQFAISVVLIVGTIAVLRQIDFMRSQSLGFDSERLVSVEIRGVPGAQMTQRYETVKETLLRQPGVQAVSASGTTPGRLLPLLLTVSEGLEVNDSRRLHYVWADHDFARTFGIRVIAGRDFSRSYETDTAEATLINETAVRTLGWASPDDALGNWIQVGSNRRTIVGVFRDYHHLSLKQQVEPMAVMIMPQAFVLFTMRIEGPDLQGTLASVRTQWAELFPGRPFKYFFVDESFNEQYVTEARLSQILGIFAGLAVFVACLGLFGLAAYSAELRRREVGVRKVLGASVGQVVTLLSRDFLILVAVALFIGGPVAYWGVNRWLDGFAHRVPLGIDLLLTAGALTLLIAMITVGVQAARAAAADPVASIRTD